MTAPSPSGPAVRVDGLTKRFGDVTALDGLSLSVGRGELYGLLGPNGAGKSTAINVLTGQLRPDSGSAEVLGVDPVAEPVAAREVVGVLPEGGAPPSFLTPREYFSFVAATRSLDDVDGRVAEWADRLGFRSRLDTLAADLSQGERQKVMIAAAFLHEPELVFIDEPLTNLDPIVQERVKRHLAAYRERGNTLFLSTHFVETAQALCSRVGIVRDGRLVAEVDPDDLDDGGLLDRFVEAVDEEPETDPTATRPAGPATDGPAADGSAGR